MGSGTRAEAAKLRAKYAKAFDVPLESVKIEEAPDEDALVSCPDKPDLPVWSTGVLPKRRPVTVVSKRKR